MKKILIIGSDVHAVRYISSFIFNDNIKLYILNNGENAEKLAKKYNLQEIFSITTEENINNFDYIIFTIPNGFKKETFDFLNHYKGSLLLEKPQREIKMIKKLKCNIYFIHLRDFNDNTNMTIKKDNYITWPNLNSDGMDAIINTAPNVLDYIVNLLKKDKIGTLNISNINRNADYISFIISVNKVNFEIKIYNTDDKNKLPTINDIIIEWPNFFVSINKFSEKMLKNKLDYAESITREEMYMNIINKLKGE